MRFTRALAPVSFINLLSLRSWTLLLFLSLGSGVSCLDTADDQAPAFQYSPGDWTQSSEVAGAFNSTTSLTTGGSVSVLFQSEFPSVPN